MLLNAEPSMSLGTKDVAHIATLARIRVAEADLSPLAGNCRDLAWIEQLNEVDTSRVEPMTGVLARPLPQRDDTVTDGAIAEKILMNAPEPAHGFFTVPKVVE
jgi:aspartyl-tRNA(Asn)/glutamyl-tRNA(Gln) amidotransferase subunit C